MPVSTPFFSTCKHCKAWCCTLVKPLVTLQEKNKILQAGFSDHFIQIEKEIYQLQAEDQKPCQYLKEDCSCEIQKVKPTLCKIFPMIPRYTQGKLEYILINCPLACSLTPSDIQQAKKEAETLPPLLLCHLWDISSDIKNKYKRLSYKKL